MDFLQLDTPLGAMALGAEGGSLVRLYLPGAPTPRLVGRETPLLAAAAGQLLSYLAGRRRDFVLPISPQGTPFQAAVWRALSAIPYGETRTYGEIAAQVGVPGAGRAVGSACHKNPLPILVPCHRVVGAGGRLTGYAGGLTLKEQLLELENPGSRGSRR